MNKYIFREVVGVVLFMISLILLFITIVLITIDNNYAELFTFITVVIFIASMYNYYDNQKLISK